MGDAARGAGAFPSGWAVPAHDVHVLAPRRTRHCVCVFVLNEGERFRRQLERMRAVIPTADIVVADGNSTDGSTSPEALAALGVRALLVNRGVRGLSAQMRMGFAWALAEGYEGVITIDGNDKDDPSAIPAFAAALDEGVDHVQGSRYVPGGVAINTPLKRHFAVRLIHAPLISRAAGFRYTDTTNGFRAYSGRFLRDPRVSAFRDVFVGYEMHYYLAIRAPQLGYRVAELPVTRAYPATGKVPSKIAPFRGDLKVLRTLLAVCRGAYHPSPIDAGHE